MSEYKHDQVREHAHDGIEEYDNQLPNWWLWILYGTIVFAVGYWLVFHTLGMVPNSRGSLRPEMEAAARAELARMAEAGTTTRACASWARSAIASPRGRQIFMKYCVACHAERGQGNVGPNLTDQYWIHGGSADGHPRHRDQWRARQGDGRVGSPARTATRRLGGCLRAHPPEHERPGKEAQGELYEGD